MLQLSNTLLNQTVLSVRNGGPIAIATKPIINPNNLKIEGWYCQDRFKHTDLILQFQEVREIIPQGIIVNDHDALSEPDDLVRLKDIIDLEFELLGKPVITVHKEKLGKVSDYSCEVTSLYIQKLYISQPLLKSFTGGNLTIDRNQIVEITNRKIVVNEPLERIRRQGTASVPAVSAG